MEKALYCCSSEFDEEELNMVRQQPIMTSMVDPPSEEEEDEVW